MAWYDEMVAELSASGVELNDGDMNILSKYQNNLQFAKAAMHAFRRASGAITIPDKADRTAVIEVLKKLGADKDAYELAIPDGFPEDVRPSDEEIAAFKQAAFDRGELPFQVKDSSIFP